MKLAKKMLACVMALALVAALAVTAFAADPTLNMTASNAYVGENVVVNVSASDWVGFKSADLIFTYDADVLQFVSIEEPADKAYKTAEGDLVDGEITWSFYFREEAVAADSTSIATITFKVLKAGDAKLDVRVDSWEGSAQPADTSLTIKATVAPATPDTPATPDAPEEPVSGKDNETKKSITQTGEAGVAAIAGVMALAAVAFVATRKKDEE